MAENPIKAEYPLQISPARSVVAVVCFAAITAALVWHALTNRDDLAIGGFVLLPARAATRAYWLAAAFCGVALLPITLSLAWRALFVKQHIAFTRSSVWIPRGAPVLRACRSSLRGRPGRPRQEGRRRAVVDPGPQGPQVPHRPVLAALDGCLRGRPGTPEGGYAFEHPLTPPP